MNMHLTKNIIRPFLSVVVLGALVVGCSSVERNPLVPGTYSDKLSPYNYKEEGP